MGVLVSEKPDPLLNDSKSVKIATFSRTDTFLVKAKLNMGMKIFITVATQLMEKGQPMEHPKKYPWEAVAGVINLWDGQMLSNWVQENNGYTVHGLAVSMLQVVMKKHGFFMLILAGFMFTRKHGVAFGYGWKKMAGCGLPRESFPVHLYQLQKNGFCCCLKSLQIIL